MMNTQSQLQEAKKNFENELNWLASKESCSTVFNNFLDYALWALNINRTKADEEAVMQQFHKENAKNYTTMLMAFSVLAEGRGDGFHDALGDLFMEYVSHGNNGQYFSPEPMCNMMSRITIHDPAELAGKSICDPACGSGRMLLAAGQRAAEVGVRNIRFSGADIDPTCCKMAVLNMLINTMCGEIAHMDTLRMEHWKSWHISRVLLDNGYWVPVYRVSGPGETDFVQRLKATLREQSPTVAVSAEIVGSGHPETVYKTDNRGQLIMF